ncbi:shikimate kinase [Lederbergia wuyishanensis]|uniref:Shikimate kinase n=1 Tax=Lederbergia wuyishanensis TaxID=1347903 RepID=A0ABU0D1C8_9BACI|nr:shikimate kinase [Lederbergia wuyishanensis]MCJ8006817.1 shikimate kinase [Lederbergia wuyishanensis]MDQ0342200.1 shikimate kinase [Lederbergia wuyishanensis]
MEGKSIYLIGFMGAGKTSIGHELGKKTGLPVIDTDELFEKFTGIEIRNFFELYGEQRFREKETEILLNLSNHPSIITTGGGIILKEKNRQFLQKSGRVIFLQCHPDVFLDRLKDDQTRPLIKNKSVEEIKEMYEKRLPLYMESSTVTIDTSDLSIEEAAELIINRMNL